MSDIEFIVVSYNVNGIGDDQKRRKMFNCLKKKTSNKAVIFMQEIHSTEATEKCLEYQWEGKMLFSHGTSSSAGVCICFSHNQEHKVIKVVSDPEGGPYVLVNCCAPNSETA